MEDLSIPVELEQQEINSKLSVCLYFWGFMLFLFVSFPYFCEKDYWNTSCTFKTIYGEYLAVFLGTSLVYKQWKYFGRRKNFEIQNNENISTKESCQPHFTWLNCLVYLSGLPRSLRIPKSPGIGGKKFPGPEKSLNLGWLRLRKTWFLCKVTSHWLFFIFRISQFSKARY